MSDTTMKKLPAVEPNGNWRELAKWALGGLVAIVCFLSINFGFVRITKMEDRQATTEKKVERIDQKQDDMKAQLDRIERKIEK